VQALSSTMKIAVDVWTSAPADRVSASSTMSGASM